MTAVRHVMGYRAGYQNTRITEIRGAVGASAICRVTYWWCASNVAAVAVNFVGHNGGGVPLYPHHLFASVFPPWQRLLHLCCPGVRGQGSTAVAASIYCSSWCCCCSLFDKLIAWYVCPMLSLLCHSGRIVVAPIVCCRTCLYSKLH